MLAMVTEVALHGPLSSCNATTAGLPNGGLGARVGGNRNLFKRAVGLEGR